MRILSRLSYGRRGRLQRRQLSARLSCAKQRKLVVSEIALKTIVITGARGYIGSALAEKLARQGYMLRLVSRSSSHPVISMRPACEHRAADLRDPHCWSDLLRDANVVVHLSSRTDLRAAEADPADDENINLRPLRALVEAAGAMDTAPTIVFASAATIVGPHPRMPADDGTPDDPCSIYDRHKLAGEMILREATNGGAIRACSLRLSNVYGLGGASVNANRGILNIMMKRAIDDEPLTLYGDGAYLRDFIHIEDVVEAFLRAMTTPGICDGSHYVIASGRGHTLAEAYAMIADVAMERLQRRVEIVRLPEPADLHPIEKRDFIGDPHVFRTRTGWRPRFDLRSGITDYFVRGAAGDAH
jgi:nucleoside-diphosphate-sugar epimerase